MNIIFEFVIKFQKNSTTPDEPYFDGTLKNNLYESLVLCFLVAKYDILIVSKFNNNTNMVQGRIIIKFIIVILY